MKKRVATLIAASLILAACSSTQETATPEATTEVATEKIQIVAGFYPLAYAAEGVAGDLAEVVSLAGPGVEPHDLELTPGDVAKINDADLVVYIPEFIPALDAVVKTLDQSKVINATQGITLISGDSHSHEGEEAHSEEGGHSDESATDPHIWLNPSNMVLIGNSIAKALSALTSDSAIDENRSSFENGLNALATDYTAKLANCSIKALVVSHEAFGYIANAYGFEQVGISGLSPEAEPSPARLAEVAKIAKAENATTIYYESLVDPKVAKTLADDLKITAEMLDPLESPPASGDYLSVMQQNLDTLVKGQVCS
ncbi:MAG: metal ABC transporter substrate-binding protein [Actinobacteria bacterium]|nr:metal ABC transporter substrate-binding protein [Actinomycetota bacterium]